MIPKEVKLNSKIFKKNNELEDVANRFGFGRGLLEVGKRNERIIAISADLTESTKIDLFKEEFPKRFIEMGVAEQNLVTFASGIASLGFIPFVSSYATFSPGRNWEQIRTTICYNNSNVKIIGSHAGLSVGPDGATHQALEDVALMRVLPNMSVVVPCDEKEAFRATQIISEHPFPCYLRLSREKSKVFTTDETPMVYGRAYLYFESDEPEVVVIANGPIVFDCLNIANELKESGLGIIVINCPFVKPLDEELLVHSIKRARAVVVVEEHQKAGGLIGAIAELIVSKIPVPMEAVGINDSFGESGLKEELMHKFKINKESIIESIIKVIKRKRAITPKKNITK